MIEYLKIGYRRYRVESLDADEARRVGRYGDWDEEHGLIRVADGRRSDHQAETIIHEALHAIVHDMGAGLADEENETLVTRLTPRLTAFLADNPDEVRELLGMLTHA